MSTYSGTLKSKKKSDLQGIASSLAISSAGTKDELETRIKGYLDTHETKLMDDPTYSGLYGRKKRSAHLAAPGVPNDSDDDGTTPPPAARNAGKLSRGAVALRSKALEVAQIEPVHVQPVHVEPVHFEPAQAKMPPSPVRAIIQEVQEVIEKPEVVVERIRTSEWLRDSQVYLDGLRAFVSNSSNISTLTVVSELMFIIYTIVPWQYFLIPLTPPFKTYGIDASSVIARIPYAPLDYVLSAHPWGTVFYWLLPTLLVPQLFGALISFSTPRRKVDPLSAAIVRVALAVAGQWGLNEGILNTKWRVLDASVAAAFALAESVESASRVRQ
ncbi:hypothetical protein BKA62DRAFT_245275 [Auriculariales sp. MPI-PUGE-AT-0066]|nr:hypothetical protein BKA62DRAFT_245275 [Auriculariales sp. MPI-PUGE-AT-0066]